MKTNTERARNFRDAAKQSNEIRQINLWLPTETVALLDSMAKHECSSRRAVIVRLLREARA